MSGILAPLLIGFGIGVSLMSLILVVPSRGTPLIWVPAIGINVGALAATIGCWMA